MSSLWLPGVPIVAARNDGGSMLGGNAYITWHTFEVDAEDLTAKRGAEILNNQNTQVHFVVDPVDGDIVQMIPANRAARGLVNLSGGVQTNRAGRVHLQVEVLARAGKPFTKLWTEKGKAAIHKISAFARALGVPDTWPAGQPLGSYGAAHRRIGPGPSGHYAHSQWRENVHWDTGFIAYLQMYAPKPAGSAIPSLPAPTPTGTQPLYSRSKTKTLQGYLELTKDGFWGSGTDSAALRMREVAFKGNRSRSYVLVVQRIVDTAQDGVWGPKTAAALKAWVKSLQILLGVTADGIWGPGTDKAFLTFRKNNLNKF